MGCLEGTRMACLPMVVVPSGPSREQLLISFEVLDSSRLDHLPVSNFFYKADLDTLSPSHLHTPHFITFATQAIQISTKTILSKPIASQPGRFSGFPRAALGTRF
jgi:hypothetical protein